MEPLKYDKVVITPIPCWDAILIEWARKKFLQVRILNGKIHIKINGLKVFKTMEIDGIDMECGGRICKECLLKYGEKIKGRKNLFNGGFHCRWCLRQL